ncbi:MAG: 2-oxoglutarate dehydrogenase E1 subunit family protein, partial [Gallionella sp.]
MSVTPKTWQQLQNSSLLNGANAPFIEELYEQYLQDPKQVPLQWQHYFDELQVAQQGAADVAHTPIQQAFAAQPKNPAAHLIAPDVEFERKQVKVLQLINAHRFLGLRIANLDPLNRHAKPVVPELQLAYYDLSDADLNSTFETGSLVGSPRMTLREILKLLRQTYCSSIGAEYMYISDVVQKRWIQNRLESVRGLAGHDATQRRRTLQRLTAAETLERYLHTKYVGQKRFSLEGGETLIPLLDHLLQRSGAQGVQEAVIGMAHRGRLNVLVNILGKQPSMLFAEFEGIHADHLTSGDVKYHQGFSADIATAGGD